VRLTDPWFEAEFYGNVTGGSFCCQGASIEGAQGIFLFCPCRGGHALIIPFANPRNAPPVPPEHGPSDRGGTHRPRWQMTGTGLADLTLSPSVDVGDSCWHGFITGGEVR
jgi:hypothetical protein